VTNEIAKKITYGVHAVNQLLHQRPDEVSKIYVLQGSKNPRLSAVLADAKKHQNIDIIEVGKEDLYKISQSESNQGIVAVASESKQNFATIEDMARNKGNNPLLILVLDGILDPHNLGSCIRSAAAFNVDGIVIPKDNAVQITPAVRKVASGGADIVPVYTVTNLARTLTNLAELGVWIYGFAEKATSIADTKFSKHTALVLGNEGKGMRNLTAQKCDYLLSLPTARKFSTLNVSVACGVVLYEAFKQLK
jgi:23S rRNA (guanosine2251-2'-O)-methyltransferase